MRDATPRIHGAGAELVIVGNGSTAHARMFIEDMGLATPVFTDPGLRAYRAAGMRAGARTVFNLRTMKRALQAWLRGARQGEMQGAWDQQGGVLVIVKGGDVVYAYASAEAGDHPPVDEIVAAIPRA